MPDISQYAFLPLRDYEMHERFLRDFYANLLGDPLTQLNGRRGFGQKGIDLYGRDERGYVGVSAKLRDGLYNGRLTRKDLRKEVKDARGFNPPLTKMILSTTLPRDPELQEEARLLTEEHLREGLFSVHVHFWDDVRDQIGNFPAVANRWLPCFVGGALPSGGIHPEPAEEQNTVGSRSQSVLPLSIQEGLGLLATCPFPIYLDALERYASAIAWEPILKRLVVEGILRKQDDLQLLFTVPQDSVLGTPEVEAGYRQRWIEMLRSAPPSVDGNFFLIMALVLQQDLDTSLTVFAETASSVTSGYWAGLYVRIFELVRKSTAFNHLVLEQKLNLIYGLATCKTSAEQFFEAKSLYRELEQLAKGTPHRWAVGQSLLGLGVTCYQLGEEDDSRCYLEQATSYGKRVRDYELVAKASYNLATQLIRSDDLIGAKKLADISLRYRHKYADGSELAVVMLLRGEIAGYQGNHEEAFRTFILAAKQARKEGYFEAECVAKFDAAMESSALGRHSKAVSLLEDVLSKVQPIDWESMTNKVKEHLCYELAEAGRTKEAEKQFRESIADHLERQNFDAAVHSLHDLAAILCEAGRHEDGKSLFAEAWRVSLENGLDDWCVRCTISEICTAWPNSSDYEKLASVYARCDDARDNGKRGVLRGILLGVLEAFVLGRTIQATIVMDLLMQCRRAWGKRDDFESRLQLHKLAYYILWQAGRHDEAIKELESLESYADQKNEFREELIAASERAMCLISCKNFENGLAVVRAALPRARRRGFDDLVTNLLHNRAECYSRMGRFKDAVNEFAKCEDHTLRISDGHGQISAMHGRAIALSDLGDFRSAMSLLRRCERASIRLGDLDEEVRSLTGLANVVKIHRGSKAAIPFYERALDKAKIVKSEESNAILVNLTQCHSELGKHDLVLELLSRRRLPVDPLHLTCWQRQLAESYLALGRSKKALASSIASYEAARQMEDTEELTAAIIMVVRVRRSRYEIDEARAMLVEGLALTLLPEYRAELLCEFSQVNLLLGDDGLVSDALNELYSIAESCPAAAAYLVDAHMLAGDHLFLERKEYSHAAVHYAMGVLTKATLLIDDCEEIYLHATRHFMDLAMELDKNREKELARISDNVKEFLPLGLKGKHRDTLLCLAQFPIRVARELTRPKKNRLPPEEIMAVAFADMNEIFGGTSYRDLF